MTDTFTKVRRGARVKHPNIGPAATLAQLETLTRATYRGVPPVPADAPVYDWRVCGCDYATPLIDGKPVRQADNPAYRDWSEKDAKGKHSLAKEVRRLVLLYGHGYFDAKDAFRSFPGWPDCTIWTPGTWEHGQSRCSGGRIVRELKGMTTETYGQQLATMTTMRLSGDDVGVWKPCCLLSGRISAELRQLAGIDRPDPRDLHGLQAPAGRPAISGPAYPPGTIPQDPPATDPMGDGVPMGAQARPRPSRAAAAAAEVLGVELAGTATTARVVDRTHATGYVLPTALTEAEASIVRRLRAWAVDWGVSPADLVWPWRLVVTDDRYSLQVHDRAGGWRWHEMSRLSGALVPVVNLVMLLNPHVVAVTGVEACKRAIGAPAPAHKKG